MARPKTKAELMTASETQFEKLLGLIDTIPTEKLTTEFEFDLSNKKEAHWKRDQNLRDVLIHLYEWHQLILNWVPANLAGKEQPFLKAGYNWKTYGAMNVDFWEQHQVTPYEKARQLVTKSHQEVMALANQFSEEELFTKKVFPWVGGSTLGSYFISSTASHYDWAAKKVRLFKKSFA